MSVAFKVAANSPKRHGRYGYTAPKENPPNPWKKWFAWRPVKIKNKIVWLKIVYRREIPKTYSTYDDWTRYEYGNIFDVLKHG